MNRKSKLCWFLLAAAVLPLGCSPRSGPTNKEQVAQGIVTERHALGGIRTSTPKLRWRDGSYDITCWLELQQPETSPAAYLLGMMFDGEKRNYVDRAQEKGGGKVRFLRGEFQGGAQDYQECYIELSLGDLGSTPKQYEFIGSSKTFTVQLPDYYYSAFLEHVKRQRP